MLGAFVVVDLYFFGCDLLTSGFPEAEGAEIVAMLVSGPLAPFFWVEVVGCALAAVMCFRAEAAHEPARRGGVASRHRRHLLQARAVAGRRFPDSQSGSFDGDDVEHGHPLGGRHGRRLPGHGVLSATTSELGVTLGVVGLGVLLLCLGLKYLPLRPAGDEA